MEIVRFQTYKFFSVLIFLFFTHFLYSQGNGAFSVQSSGNLNFGTFTPGPSLGEITVDTNGNYNPLPTGGIATLPFGQSPSAVSFSVTTPNNGKLVTVTPISTQLTGPGGNLILDLIYDPVNFIANNATTLIKMGGILKVPSTITEGNYSGTITVTFSYQ